MQLRICVISHTSAGGHRGYKATETAIRREFVWSTIKGDIKTFLESCLHRKATTGSSIVPRPFGPAVHGNRPHELLQFDYLSMAPGNDSIQYILMLRDDFSSFCWLFPFSTPAAENTALAILEWCSSFKVPRILMSHQGTHFKNETVRELTRLLKVLHHFTLPCSPWRHGAIERLGREVLRVFRATLSELQMAFEEWPDLIPLVQSALNNNSSSQRRNRAPITAFMGAEPGLPLSCFRRSTNSKLLELCSDIRSKVFNLGTVKSMIYELHPIIECNLKHNRDMARNSTSKGRIANFDLGDFVLVPRSEFSKGQKLALRWRGPRRVVGIRFNHIYQVEDMRKGSVSEVHASRLKFYRDNELDTVAIMPFSISSETGMEIQRLMKLVREGGQLKVHLRWKGLPNSEDTLEPLNNIYADVPELLMCLLRRKQHLKI